VQNAARNKPANAAPAVDRPAQAGGGLSRRRVLGGVAAAGMLPAPGLLHAESPADGRRLLRFTLTATNPTQATLQDPTLWIYMPVRETPTQVLEELRVSAPHQVSSDVLAHSVVRLGFGNVAPLASRIVTFTAQVRLAAQPLPQPLADPQAWLRPQRFVEVDDPAVQAAAARLQRPTAMATAGAIYDWVRGHLRYAGYLAGELGAREALATQRGDCTEYASLATALARASGIPARRVGGYVATGSITPRPQDYHDWAELYVDGAWRTLDAQKEQWQPHPPGYVAFRIDAGEAINPIGLAHRFRTDGELQIRL
jgi:transglutaminase-like putative cysteine protease